MLDLLESPVQQGTATAARLKIPVGGKTGTSQDYRDAWFVGFTPDVVVGVWVGNDDNTPMKRVTGGSIPAAIWHDFVAGGERVSPAAAAVNLSSREMARAPVFTAPTAASTPDDIVLSGKLNILGDGTVQLGGKTIQLAGVERLERALPRRIRYMLRHRPVTCTSSEEPDAYNCTLGNLDLNALILLSRVEAPNIADLNEAQDVYEDTPRRTHRRDRHQFWFFRW
jgi:membrane peptidoglycan carboxypeptidase